MLDGSTLLPFVVDVMSMLTKKLDAVAEAENRRNAGTCLGGGPGGAAKRVSLQTYT